MSFLILHVIQASIEIVATLFMSFLFLHVIQASVKIVATLFMPFIILPHAIQASSKTVATLFMLHPVIDAVLFKFYQWSVVMMFTICLVQCQWTTYSLHKLQSYNPSATQVTRRVAAQKGEGRLQDSCSLLYEPKC